MDSVFLFFRPDLFVGSNAVSSFRVRLVGVFKTDFFNPIRGGEQSVSHAAGTFSASEKLCVCVIAFVYLLISVAYSC